VKLNIERTETQIAKMKNNKNLGAEWVEQLLESINRSLHNLSATTESIQQNQKLSLLTPREKEVFDVLALGKSHREIGELLKISPRTVEVHKGRVLEKLGIKTLADILRIAIKT
jgi:DNA-binding NarL/FixJ family response regulator